MRLRRRHDDASVAAGEQARAGTAEQHLSDRVDELTDRLDRLEHVLAARLGLDLRPPEED